jgi:hypothetical protein
VLARAWVRATSPADPPGHLSREQLQATHAAAFEGEALAFTAFASRLRHLQTCDRCHARFLQLHEALTPSSRAVALAIANFGKGLDAQPLGDLHILRRIWRVMQRFQPASGAEMAQAFFVEPFSATVFKQAFAPDPVREARLLVTSPPKGAARLWAAFKDFVTGRWLLRLLRRLRRGIVQRVRGSLGLYTPDSLVTGPSLLHVSGFVLSVTARSARGALILDVIVSDEGAGRGISGVTITALASEGQKLAGAETDESGRAHISLQPMPESVRFDFGPGHSAWSLRIKASNTE